MKWFKFYSQDYLTDPKMLSLNAVDKAVWITLLCLANNTEDGEVKYINESKLLTLAGIDVQEDLWNIATGVLERFRDLNMVELTGFSIIVINFKKRQEINLSDAERAKNYRERKKSDVRHTPSRDDRHARIDKNRIEKNTKENKTKEKETLAFIEKFNTFFGTSYQVTKGRDEKIKARLENFTMDQILQALANLSRSPFHRGNNDRKWVADPDFLIRSDEMVDKWLNASTPSKPKRTIPNNDDMGLPKESELVTPERMVELRKNALKVGVMPKNI
jgi:hypothetical protein